MSFITVWSQDFKQSERIPADAAQALYFEGFIKAAFKPNRKGNKMKRVWVSVPKLENYRDQSCSMGPRVIWGNAIGLRRYVAITEAWAR